jgi:hypothetical protein
MMKFTIKERADIYLRAAELMASMEFDADDEMVQYKGYRFACVAISNVVGFENSNRVDADLFPEFYMFKDVERDSLWLGNSHVEQTAPGFMFGNSIRQTVLLLCHEMCKD